MASLASLRGAFQRQLATKPSQIRPSTHSRHHGASTQQPGAVPPTGSRFLSSSSSLSAPPPAGRPVSKGKKQKGAEGDPKVKIMSKALRLLNYTPPPLRMARNRYLRHWTIHRAWLLFRRKSREARERELMQQYQSMQNACEELRNTAGPGTRELGYLYRVAMEKKGVWGHDGIPIEYARAQTETPAREAWNHGWKR